MIEIQPGDESSSTGAITLDSAPSAGPWSRWSYIPGPPLLHLRCDSTGLAVLRDAGREIMRWTDPRMALAWISSQCIEPPREGPPLKGGWVGYLSYDLGRWFERIPQLTLDDLGMPLFEFTFHAQVLARGDGSWRINASHPWSNIPIVFASSLGHSDEPLTSNFTRPAYESAVARAIDYIAAGDIFQVNLSQRFTAGLREPPQRIYQRMRQQSPAAFGAYLDYGDHALLCNSPELFLRVTPDPLTAQRRVVTRPIKGTRPRREGMERELLDSIKDQAELNMIVDLERNDLGRVCRIGSVRVTEPRVIEAHPTVYHGVATVEGILRDEVSFVDLLAATFPGGSITGAPKIRAMEIIEELEPHRRGPYCGAIGYLSLDGHIELNLAIRTMTARGDRVYIPVGGGIVADSSPSGEYEETLVKAKAMLDALGEGT